MTTVWNLQICDKTFNYLYFLFLIQLNKGSQKAQAWNSTNPTLLYSIDSVLCDTQILMTKELY